MRRQAAWMSPLTPLSGVPQVHRAVPAEAGRRVLPLRGAEPDGRALAAEIGGPSRMYVCPGRPQTSRGASAWGVPARHLQAPQGPRARLGFCGKQQLLRLAGRQYASPVQLLRG